MKRTRTLFEAIYHCYEHSGFSLAGAVAFSFIVSLFPFCIFLGALAGLLFGGRELADSAVQQLFTFLPKPVAEALAPQVVNIMTYSRVDLLTFGGFIALFFATSAIETMRAALNSAYRARETRPYWKSLGVSTIFVFVCALATLSLTWIIVVAPRIAEAYEPDWAKRFFATSLADAAQRYALAGGVIGALLTSMHLWLAAGKRTLRQVWPGIAVSVVLWLITAALYSYYLNFSDYSRFYAGLTQIMVALLFFQWTAIIIIVGAEVNRGLMEVGRLRNGEDLRTG
jgi:membrane protein